jgi:hypothetical protein
LSSYLATIVLDPNENFDMIINGSYGMKLIRYPSGWIYTYQVSGATGQYAIQQATGKDNSSYVLGYHPQRTNTLTWWFLIETWGNLTFVPIPSCKYFPLFHI